MPTLSVDDFSTYFCRGQPRAVARQHDASSDRGDPAGIRCQRAVWLQRLDEQSLITPIAARIVLLSPFGLLLTGQAGGILGEVEPRM